MPLALLCLAAAAAAVLASSLPPEMSGPVGAVLAACIAVLALPSGPRASARS